MENKNDLQDLSLDEMLSELHDLVGEEIPDVEVEPDEELQELLAAAAQNSQHAVKAVKGTSF